MITAKQWRNNTTKLVRIKRTDVYERLHLTIIETSLWKNDKLIRFTQTFIKPDERYLRKIDINSPMNTKLIEARNYVYPYWSV